MTIYIYISFVHADHPEVVSVFLNKPTKKLTTGAWNFLGLEKDNVIPSNSTWERARFGEDVIIGGIDSGNQVSSYPFNFSYDFDQFYFTQ